MGPGGRWPANTPAYDAVATDTIASISELPSTLDAASSGDVVEIEPGMEDDDLRWSDAVTGGSPSWNENVLVRPPLGRRGSRVVAATIDVSVANVTFAGLHFNGGSFRFEAGERTALAWSTFDGGARVTVAGGDGMHLVECVRADYDDSSGSQLINVRGGNGSHLRNVRIRGCWMAGGTATKDNLQTMRHDGFGPTDVLVEDSVFLTGWDKVLESNTSDPDPFTIRNCWFDSPATSPVSFESSYDSSVNVRTRDGLVEDVVCLGRVRLQDGVATVRNSYAREVSDDPQHDGDSTALTTENVTIDDEFDYEDFPPPMADVSGSGPRFTGDLDDVWHA